MSAAATPPTPPPTPKKFSLVKCLWGIVTEMDAALHAAIMRAFPRAIPVFDRLLESAFGVVTHAAFALIAALLLGVLMVTGVIKAIVFWSISFAWVVALLWIARAERVRKLTVMFRLIFVGAIAAALAMAGNGFGHWALDAYNRQKAAEHSEQPNNGTGTPNAPSNPSEPKPSVQPIPNPEEPKGTRTVRGGPPLEMPKALEVPRPSAPPPTTATAQPGKPTLETLFREDFIYTFRWRLDSGMDVQTPDGSKLPIKRQLYADFQGNSIVRRILYSFSASLVGE